MLSIEDVRLHRVMAMKEVDRATYPRCSRLVTSLEEELFFLSKVSPRADKLLDFPAKRT
jgi:hypothetical protein